ncbi:sulfatase family protein [Christiangramia crocea]|uniref:Sulfatase n=1 Tax=Christiangramia crocea TaxID=2904124 RepID=A0A9X1UYC6_9FLAO|nr:sulfatase [Gramella crocea]MCG9972560.1 sulfatase [Gramella crocea]
MKNLVFYLTILLIAGCKGKETSDTIEVAETDYNILWIIADDLGTDIGAFGTDVYTPNLDRLASESVVYKKMFTTTAVCSASRSGIITGMYPVSIDAHQHRTSYKKELPDSIQPITEYFKEAGYFVSNGNGNPKAKGGKTDYNFKYKASEMYDGGHWRQRPDSSKFFSQVQIFLPHRPFHHDSLHPVNPDKVKIPPYYPDHPLIRKDWAMYLETVQLADRQVGEILDQLEEDGLLDKTIIFFFGDQGRPHARAKQFLYDPGTNTPFMVRWPDGKGAGSVSEELVSNIDIPFSTLKLAGIEPPSHMQGQDFLFEDVERDYVFTMRDRRDETEDRIRAVRSDKFKYIHNYFPDKPYTQANVYKEMRYPALPLLRFLDKQGKLNADQKRFISDERPEEEFYDLSKDPYEVNNLAESETYRDELKKYRDILNDWVAKYDLGTYPEDRDEIKAAEENAMSRRSNMLKERGLPEDYTDEQMVNYWMKELNIKNDTE